MDFTKKVKEFFEQKKVGAMMGSAQVFFLRKDGVLLFTNRSPEDAQSIGVLMGGIWHAAAAVSDYIPSVQKHDGFRLTFDTSSRGIYILPVTLKSGEFFLGTLYFDQTNPAVMKHQLRELQGWLMREFDQEMDRAQPQYLFQNISDEEINSIFSTVGQ